MDTVTSDIILMIEELGFGTFGDTLFCGRVPDSLKTPTELWLLVQQGVSPLGKHNPTGENILVHTYRLYFRSNNFQKVDQNIYLATKVLNAQHCRELPHFTITDINVTGASTNFDVDSENRVIGYAAFEVNVYNISKE